MSPPSLMEIILRSLAEASREMLTSLEEVDLDINETLDGNKKYNDFEQLEKWTRAAEEYLGNYGRRMGK